MLHLKIVVVGFCNPNFFHTSVQQGESINDIEGNGEHH